jgi:hypothetical protein
MLKVIYEILSLKGNGQFIFIKSLYSSRCPFIFLLKMKNQGKSWRYHGKPCNKVCDAHRI